MFPLMVSPLAVLCALLVAATPGEQPPAPASEPARADAHMIATFGYDVGVGETVDVQVESGGGAATRGIRLNGGIVTAAGIAWAPRSDGPIELRATIGVKRGAMVSSGANLAYRAVPIELLAAWRARSLRIGAGVSVALGPSVEGADAVSAVSAHLKTSLGIVGQLEWTQRDPGARLGSSFGARVLWQTLESEAGGTVAAPAFGLFAGLSY